MLIDCHCHIQDIGAQDRVGEFFRLAAQAGIGKFLCNCAGPGDWDAAAAIAAAYPCVTPFFGIHPWYAGQAKEEDFTRLAGLLRRGGCGLGEIGLDWMRKSVDFALQEKALDTQISLALEAAVPFSVHCVGGWEELLRALSAVRLRAPFVMHAYSGTIKDMERLLGMGAYISVRHIDETNGRKFRLVEAVPLDRLLLETDFPYLAGVKRGTETLEMHAKRLRELYASAARIKGVERGALEAAIESNGSVFTHGNTIGQGTA